MDHADTIVARAERGLESTHRLDDVKSYDGRTCDECATRRLKQDAVGLIKKWAGRCEVGKDRRTLAGLTVPEDLFDERGCGLRMRGQHTVTDVLPATARRRAVMLGVHGERTSPTDDVAELRRLRQNGEVRRTGHARGGCDRSTCAVSVVLDPTLPVHVHVRQPVDRGDETVR